MHENIRAGDTLFIGAPVNNFSLREGAKRSILIAGGIGITPIMSMAHELRNAEADFEIYYLTRSEAETAFRDVVEGAQFASKVTIHHDEGNPAMQFDVATLLREVRPETHVYCCGPAGLMAAIEKASSHWPSHLVHFEYFSNAAELEKKSDQAFEVVLAKTGVTLTVDPGETILQVLLQNDVDVAYSCEEGTCGTCVTKVLEGVPDHRDVVLDATERASNQSITVCCSRAKTPRLVLDL
jgi:vanillate O-demethylase ferredoxin subunit